MNHISILRADITRLEADCIVNAANSGLLPGGGVCGAIFRAAGYEELCRACEAIGGCATGRAAITPGFQLPARYIIHAVGPRWSGGRHGERELLAGAYASALQLAADNGCRSIAFPLISAGIFGYPREEAWEVALTTAARFLTAHPDCGLEILFTVLDPEIESLGRAVMERLETAGV
jgi:O-acetyl-ADP-ribose deacetylase (regulator of RNase III)